MIWTALSAAGALLKRLPWPVYAIALALLCAFLWGRHQYSEGRSDERAKWEAAAAKAKARAETANATAAESRIQDIVRNIDLERARNDAIDKAEPGKAPDDASVRLNCQRLRQAGSDISRISACR